MHTIVKNRDTITVGFKSEIANWIPIRDFPFNEEREALEMVSFLNGGEMPRWWRPI